MWKHIWQRTCSINLTGKDCSVQFVPVPRRLFSGGVWGFVWRGWPTAHPGRLAVRREAASDAASCRRSRTDGRGKCSRPLINSKDWSPLSKTNYQTGRGGNKLHKYCEEKNNIFKSWFGHCQCHGLKKGRKVKIFQSDGRPRLLGDETATSSLPRSDIFLGL